MEQFCSKNILHPVLHLHHVLPALVLLLHHEGNHSGDLGGMPGLRQRDVPQSLQCHLEYHKPCAAIQTGGFLTGFKKLIEDAFDPILNSFQLCKDLINNTESFRSAGTGIPDELSGVDDVTRFSDLEMNLNDTMMNGTDICAAEEEALVCFHHTYDTLEKQVRLGMEVALMVWSILYLVKAGHEYTFLGKRIWMDNMKMCPSRLVLCASLKDNMTLI